MSMAPTTPIFSGTWKFQIILLKLDYNNDMYLYQGQLTSTPEFRMNEM